MALRAPRQPLGLRDQLRDERREFVSWHLIMDRLEHHWAELSLVNRFPWWRAKRVRMQAIIIMPFPPEATHEPRFRPRTCPALLEVPGCRTGSQSSHRSR